MTHHVCSMAGAGAPQQPIFKSAGSCVNKVTCVQGHSSRKSGATLGCMPAGDRHTACAMQEVQGRGVCCCAGGIPCAALAWLRQIFSLIVIAPSCVVFDKEMAAAHERYPAWCTPLLCHAVQMLLLLCASCFCCSLQTVCTTAHPGQLSVCMNATVAPLFTLEAVVQTLCGFVCRQRSGTGHLCARCM